MERCKNNWRIVFAISVCLLCFAFVPKNTEAKVTLDWENIAQVQSLTASVLDSSKNLLNSVSDSISNFFYNLFFKESTIEPNNKSEPLKEIVKPVSNTNIINDNFIESEPGMAVSQPEKIIEKVYINQGVSKSELDNVISNLSSKLTDYARSLVKSNQSPDSDIVSRSFLSKQVEKIYDSGLSLSDVEENVHQLANGFLFIDSDENKIGIGTTTPTYTLDVNGSINADSLYLNGSGLVVSSQWTTNGSDISYTGGNVGIGTSIPTEKLEVNGVLRVGTTDDSGMVNLGDTLTGSGNHTNGIYRGEMGSLAGGGYLNLGAWNGIAFNTSANWLGSQSTRMVIDGTTGNVGIGSSTPFAKLSIKGTGTGTGINFQTTNSNNTPLFSILDNGNVGIGTTNPTYKLDVSGTGYIGATFTTGSSIISGGAVQVASGAGLLWGSRSRLTSSTDGDITFANNNGTSFGLLKFGGETSAFPAIKRSSSGLDFRLADDSGYATTTAQSGRFNDSVLVGTTTMVITDRAKFQVVASNTAEQTARFVNASDLGIVITTNFVGGGARGIADTDDNLIAAYNPNFGLYQYGGSNAIYVNNSGYVGIGTSTPSEAFVVEGTANFSTSSARNLLGGATTLSTDASGNIIRTPSDKNLKENITPITGALNKVLQLQGVSYDFKDKNFGDGEQIGFLAQDVQKVFPQVVATGGGYLSMNYGNLVAAVVEAIKELAQKVSVFSEEVITKKIIIKNTDNLGATGITIHDRSTGEPVCVYVENGNMRTESGICGEASGSNEVINVIDNNQDATSTGETIPGEGVEPVPENPVVVPVVPVPQAGGENSDVSTTQ